ncbi:hypothetical protein NQ318_020374 [Aromia moschata]|uniref:CCHC-type domain-containing protein n=1 Tax=Aromia moschata TaxID=1265417 RepID=A0AAV8Y359_9CUCU|nr:hypothetical protein NQ318_020374 [Aromia moschata]
MRRESIKETHSPGEHICTRGSMPPYKNSEQVNDSKIREFRREDQRAERMRGMRGGANEEYVRERNDGGRERREIQGTESTRHLGNYRGHMQTHEDGWVTPPIKSRKEIVVQMEREQDSRKVAEKLSRELGVETIGDHQRGDKGRGFQGNQKKKVQKPLEEQLDNTIEGDIFKAIVKKGKLNYECELLYAEEYLGLAMCYKCCRFGHIAKYCREDDVCYKCGRGHDARECGERNERCVNCLRMFGKPGQHNARDASCPAFKINIERSRTCIKYN